tara:strand:+ start:3845 stop:4984 length:1140 start_codon:yes stop_codon:yes gene_type:complete
MEENKTPVTEVAEQPQVDNKVEKLTVKKKAKKIFEQPKDNISKVDMSAEPPAPLKSDVTKVEIPEVKEEVAEVKEKPAVLEEIKVQPEATKEVPLETVKPKIDLPENIQKVVDFVNDTGGSLEDYVRLNKNYDDVDVDVILKEYYQNTKPHLDVEEISFMLEDKFSYDSDVDDEKEVKRKKLALKEQVAEARKHLDGLKSKYYDEINAGASLTDAQKEAIEFYNKYNKDSAEQAVVNESQTKIFKEKTNEVFNNEFKGFEYNVGDKRFRFNVNDVDSVKEQQSDLNNFVKKFLNEKNEITNAGEYHKSLFTASNADAIANHFYEQGKADALKNSIESSKNINMEPRQSHEGDQKNPGGMTFKVLGDSVDDFKFKIKKRK